MTDIFGRDRRPLHRAIATVRVALVMLLVLILAACGTAATTTTKSQPSTTTTTSKGEGAKIVIKATSSTPAEIAQALDRKKPLVLLIYVAGGADDELVRKSLQKIAPRYPDVTFIMYDYSNPKEYGDIVSQLGVQYPPVVAFVDRNGTVQYLTTGFVDEGVLTQYVVNTRQL